MRKKPKHNCRIMGFSVSTEEDDQIVILDYLKFVRKDTGNFSHVIRRAITESAEFKQWNSDRNEHRRLVEELKRFSEGGKQ